MGTQSEICSRRYTHSHMDTHGQPVAKTRYYTVWEAILAMFVRESHEYNVNGVQIKEAAVTVD